jgi:hypothetical protein
MTVLWGDEFGLQGDYPRITRRHDHRGEDRMGIGEGAFIVLRDAAVLTVDLG